MNVKVVSVGAVALAALLIAACIRSQPDEPRQDSGGSQRSVSARVDGAFAAEPPDGRVVLARSEAPSLTTQDARRALLKQLFEASNLRAAVLDAWQRPEQGGRFYAGYLVDRCNSARVLEVTSRMQADLDRVDPEQQTQAIRAFDALQLRCAPFIEEEYQRFSRHELLKTTGPDILASAEQDFLAAAKNPAARSRQIQRLLDLGDPLVFEDVGIKLSQTVDPSGAAAFYFDGVYYAPMESGDLRAAYYLLPCGLGLSCDAADPELAINCAAGGGCFADRFARVKAQMSDNDPARYKRILALQRGLESAVNARDLSKFMP